MAVLERMMRVADEAWVGLALLLREHPERVSFRIRRDPALKAPDAIQLACAASAGIDLFITNDERLSQRTVRGIHFITSLSRSPI